MDNIQVTTECIKSITNIGSTTYKNICNGNINTVNWGIGEWLGGLAIIGMIIFFIIMVIKTSRDL